METSLTFTYSSDTGPALHFSQDGAIWISDIDGLSGVDASLSESQGTGQVGCDVSIPSIQAKDLTITGSIMENVEANRALLLAAFAPGTRGTLSMQQDGARYHIEGVVKRSPVVSNTQGIQQFDVSLRCPYPYWKGDDQVHRIAQLNSTFSLPFTVPAKSQTWTISLYSQSLFADVWLDGDAACPITVRMKADGQVQDPSFSKVTPQGATTLQLQNLTLAIDQAAEISTAYGRKGCTLIASDGARSNGFRHLSVDSDLDMMLTPGMNTFKYDAALGREHLTVELLAPKGVWTGV